MPAIIPMAIITRTMIAIIHIGDRTHHHDQSITFPSFNPMNRMVNTPVNPIPLELLFELPITSHPSVGSAHRHIPSDAKLGVYGWIEAYPWVLAFWSYLALTAVLRAFHLPVSLCSYPTFQAHTGSGCAEWPINQAISDVLPTPPPLTP